ncbi:hypothetical protein Lal_00036267 [Lupinus albus]|uniref:Uncharacterized protein n=1 Tax=Lupinus albus TaxID=3870 RepID=A0A6A4P5A1_LUPAL|nr:hypothetical protein Lalb_Chr18g0047191 [Lupinus albus]KAF1891920.1 hypothetical protein Lal_00036267 [Lupinus albus]
MKPHISEESSNSLVDESNRSIGEKANTTEVLKQRRLNQRRIHRSEDPIRTLIFLGSWSHT